MLIISWTDDQIILVSNHLGMSYDNPSLPPKIIIYRITLLLAVIFPDLILWSCLSFDTNFSVSWWISQWIGQFDWSIDEQWIYF